MDPIDLQVIDAFMPYIYVFCTLFAACVGSFSNVIIYRIPEHKSIAWPPSSCPKCGNRIKPYDNIPVLSWLILRGKCRCCKAPISPQYVIVEAICALFGFFLCHQIFGANANVLLLDGVFWRMGVLFVVMTLFCVGSLALAIMDWRTTEIAPEVALPIAGFGVLAAVAMPDSWPYTFVLGNIGWLDSILGGLIGGGVVVTIIGLYYLVRKRIGMGGGDIWMMIMVGAVLGWQSLPFIFLAASLQGIVGAVIAICLGKKQQTKDQNGLFRNEVAAEVEAEVHGVDVANKEKSEAAPDKAADEAPDSAETAKPETEKSEESPDKPETSDDATDKSDDKVDEALDDSRMGNLAVPFGPFIALAAIEYVFFGKWLLPLVSGNMLTPWGFMAW
ncbi:MAG: prepilin peptidase [Proteobacteria bacterium]|nr:prepilin peptidase [Pseudomonadota bacterium]